ncbi:hypothetical protein [Fructilactobacillus fructivorans]|nr:hypothetical protein [Fructilactobacillus fructivorans]
MKNNSDTKEIKELKKNGQLQEALEGQKDQNPDHYSDVSKGINWNNL